MTTFVCKVNMDNAAFEFRPASELARVLAEIAQRVKYGEGDGTVRDVNGNSVGEFHIEGPHPYQQRKIKRKPR